MNLKPQTLMVAIQCVAARTRELDAQLQNDDPQNAAELEQLLVGYDLAADDMDSLILTACDGALAHNGLLVVERSRRSRDPRFPDGYESWNSRYGETVVYYAQRTGEPEADAGREQQ